MFKAISNPVVDAIRVVFADRGPYEHEKIYEDLKRTYGQSHRHYHTLRHITEMLEISQDFELNDKKAFLAAVLYHDYIYEAERYAPNYVGMSNEQESAVRAQSILLNNGVPPEIVFRAKELILMTQTHKAPEDDHEAWLFMDTDMSIIGASQRRYSEYAGGNAREFLQVFMPETYLKGRTFFLEGAKSPIFKTAQFAGREAQAQENIQWELKHLTELASAAFMANYVTHHKPAY